MPFALNQLTSKRLPLFLQYGAYKIPGLLAIDGTYATFVPIDESLKQIQIMLDSISSIAIMKVKSILSLIDLLTQFTTQYPEHQFQTEFILDSGKQTEYFSLNKISIFSQIHFKQDFQELISAPMQFVIKSFSNQQITFIGNNKNINLAFSELALYTIKAPSDSIEQYTEKIPSGEDFHFIVFQPPLDVASTITQIVKAQSQENGIFIRHAVWFQPVEVGQIFDQQKLSTRKFDKNIKIKWTQQFPFTCCAKSQILIPPYPKFQPIKISFPVRSNPNEIWRMDADMIKFARKGDHNAIETLNDALLDILELSQPVSKLTKIQQNQHFQGRGSQIINFEQVNLILDNLHMSTHQQLYMQYQSTVDGRFLGNLYSSFLNKRNGVLEIIDKTLEVEKFEQIITSGESFLLLIQTISGVKIGAYITQKPQKQPHSGKNTAIFRLIDLSLEIWHGETENNHAVAEISNYSIGMNRPAIILNQSLLEVSTNACLSFKSPELFKGKLLPIGQVESVDIVEVIRFV